MREAFPQHEPSAEREPNAAEVRKQIEDGLEQIEQTRALLIDVAQLLDEKIPHNDVVEENKTIPFHMIRNIQLWHIDELDTHEKALRADLEELSSAA